MKYFTVEELADRHRTSPGAVHMRRHRGEGPPAHVFGKRILFAESDVEAWERSKREIAEPANSKS